MADKCGVSLWLQFSQVWVNATDSLTQEEAVMEAIYTKGPMTVSVNAEGEDWRFYKAGIYNNTRCSPKLKKLDHAVVVSGCVPVTTSFTWQCDFLCSCHVSLSTSFNGIVGGTNELLASSVECHALPVKLKRLGCFYKTSSV